MEFAVHSGTVAAHNKDYARKRSSELSRKHARTQRFGSAHDAFAQMARDFPQHVERSN